MKPWYRCARRAVPQKKSHDSVSFSKRFVIIMIYQEESTMKCEECQQELWKAGEMAPAGVYARVDDHSYHLVTLAQAGPLPPSFDGHTAWYCSSACRCATHATHAPQAMSAQ